MTTLLQRKRNRISNLTEQALCHQTTHVPRYLIDCSNALSFTIHQSSLNILSLLSKFFVLDSLTSNTMCQYFVTQFICGHQSSHRLNCPVMKVGYPTFLLPCVSTEHPAPDATVLCKECRRKAKGKAAIESRTMEGSEKSLHLVGQHGWTLNRSVIPTRKPVGESAAPGEESLQSEAATPKEKEVVVYNAFNPHLLAKNVAEVWQRDLNKSKRSKPQQNPRLDIGSISHIQDPAGFFPHPETRPCFSVQRGHDLFFEHPVKKPASRTVLAEKKGKFLQSLVAGRHHPAHLPAQSTRAGQLSSYYTAYISRRRRVWPSEIKLVTIPEEGSMGLSEPMSSQAVPGWERWSFDNILLRHKPFITPEEQGSKPEINGNIIMNEHTLPNIKRLSPLTFEGTILEGLTGKVASFIAQLKGLN